MRTMLAMLVGVALATAMACGDDEEAQPAPASDEGAQAEAQPAEPAEPEPAAPTVAQSTGSQTEVVEGDRPTLVDREIGVQITCPPDRTWHCRLDGSGMWKIRDMSSNTLTVRVVGASDLASALEAEIAHVREELPVTGVASQEEGTAVLDVGPNPDWATPVDRRAWIQVKQIGDGFYACHGVGSAGNFDNAKGDYEALCESLSAVE